jgi:hypothetical protein
VSAGKGRRNRPAQVQRMEAPGKRDNQEEELDPKQNQSSDRAWWCTSVIPALGRQRQEDHEF